MGPEQREIGVKDRRPHTPVVAAHDRGAAVQHGGCLRSKPSVDVAFDRGERRRAVANGDDDGPCRQRGARQCLRSSREQRRDDDGDTDAGNHQRRVHVAERVAVHPDPQRRADDEPGADRHDADRGGGAPRWQGIRAPQPRDRQSSPDRDADDRARARSHSGQPLEQLPPPVEPLPRCRQRRDGMRGGAVSGRERSQRHPRSGKRQKPNRPGSDDDRGDREHQADANVDPARQRQQGERGDARGQTGWSAARISAANPSEIDNP